MYQQNLYTEEEQPRSVGYGQQPYGDNYRHGHGHGHGYGHGHAPAMAPAMPHGQQHQQVSPTAAVPAGAQLPYPGQPAAPAVAPHLVNGMLPLEMSYIENILRFNRGKTARFYMTYENNPEWPAKVFEGVIEEAGRDHIIISSPQVGRNYLLLMVNLDYVEFEDEIDYIPPGVPGVAPPR
jgi:spore germination protein Q